jgi:ubiquinone/menaquinone biosynthesis C-methylase UbiE
VGSGRELAHVFTYAGVAEAYRHRPPYPEEVFAVLRTLMVDEPRTVLDLGAGDGALARRLAAWADRVDAVEVSEAMVAAGRRRAGGQHRNLRWIVGASETCELSGPYALITAGASLHWMSWPRLMPRLCRAVSAGGVLAVVEHGPREVPWHDDIVEVIRRHSRNPGYDPEFSLVDALREGGFLAPVGHAETVPVLFRQRIEDYVEQFHSTASLARELMATEEAAAFGAAAERAVAPWANDGVLEMAVVATVSWGRPTVPPQTT